MTISLVSTFDKHGGAAIASYRLFEGLQKTDNDVYYINKFKSINNRRIISFENQHCSHIKKKQIEKLIWKKLINSNRTEISNTLFSFPYSGIDISNSKIIKNSDIINIHWVNEFQSTKTLYDLKNAKKQVCFTLHDQFAFTGGCHYSSGCTQYQSNCSNCIQLKNNKELPEAVFSEKIKLFKDWNCVIISPSKWLAKTAEKSMLFRDKRIEVIPNGIDTKMFSPVLRIKEIRKKFNIANDCFVILCGALSNREKRKGFSELKIIFKKCMENSFFQEQVRQKKIIACFFGKNTKMMEFPVPTKLTGFINNEKKLAEVYNMSDIFIIPSLEDNLPNTILEAQACGKPVIGFTIGGIPDIVKNEETGMLCKLQDYERMAQKIIECVKDQSKVYRMGKKARENCVTNFTIEKQVEKYSALFQEMHLNNEVMNCEIDNFEHNSQILEIVEKIKEEQKKEFTIISLLIKNIICRVKNIIRNLRMLLFNK